MPKLRPLYMCPLSYNPNMQIKVFSVAVAGQMQTPFESTEKRANLSDNGQT